MVTLFSSGVVEDGRQESKGEGGVFDVGDELVDTHRLVVALADGLADLLGHHVVVERQESDEQRSIDRLLGRCLGEKCERPGGGHLGVGMLEAFGQVARESEREVVGERYVARRIHLVDGGAPAETLATL